MRSSAMLAPDPQDPDPGADKNVFHGQPVPTFIITVANTFSMPVTVVAFQRKHIQHGDESSVCPNQQGRTFFLKTRKDIAMMKIYRYHGCGVLRRNERGRTGRQTESSSLLYSGTGPLSSMIHDYITGRENPEEQRGWKEKTVSLPAARRHPRYSIIGILICRKAVADGHDITSLDTQASLDNRLAGLM